MNLTILCTDIFYMNFYLLIICQKQTLYLCLLGYNICNINIFDTFQFVSFEYCYWSEYTDYLMCIEYIIYCSTSRCKQFRFCFVLVNATCFPGQCICGLLFTTAQKVSFYVHGTKLNMYIFEYLRHTQYISYGFYTKDFFSIHRK